jgi:ligand-binding sensor domain-containing protein
MRFDGVRFVNWRNPEVGSPNVFTAISLLGATNGTLWIGTGRALARLRDNKLTFVPRDRTGRVNDIIEDKSGNIWIARTRMADKQGPLCRVDGTSLRCYGESDGLQCPYGNVLAADGSGGIWMGSYPGVCHWSPQGSTAYLPDGTQQGDTTRHVLSIAAPHGLPILVGFDAAGPKLGLERLVNNQWKSFDLPGFTGSSLEVIAMHVDKTGALWLGTQKQGIYHIAHGIVDHFGSGDGLSDDEVVNFFEDHEGSVWVVTAGGIDRFHTLKIVTVSTREGLLSNTVGSVMRMPDGSMAFAGLDGLTFLQDGKTIQVGAAAGFPGRLASSLYTDQKGRLWVGVDDRLMTYAQPGTAPSAKSRDAETLR